MLSMEKHKVYQIALQIDWGCISCNCSYCCGAKTVTSNFFPQEIWKKKKTKVNTKKRVYHEEWC